MLPAKNLNDALQNLSVRALSKENFNSFWVDTDESRGEYPARMLEDTFLQEPSGTIHTLFSGYRGCGKSTELQRLKLKLEEENFVVLTISVAAELDQFQFSVSELIIATMKQVFDWAKDYELDFNSEFLQPIISWTNTLVTEKITQKSVTFDATLSAKQLLAKLALYFIDLTLEGKVERKYQEIIRDEKTPVLADLIKSSNIFLNEIRQRLRNNKQGFLIMVEDLDKVNLNVSENLFVRYSSSIRALKANLIYTFPLALMSHPQFMSIIHTFDNQHFILPMVKTHDIAGKPVLPNGQDMLKEILEKRLDLSLFETPELLTKFIAYSGGVLFDLFRMVRDAISYSRIFGNDTIGEKAWEKAMNSSLRDYRSTIAETDTIKVEEFWLELKNLAESSIKKPNNTPAVKILRQNLCILGYNSQDWNEVHPLVRELLIEKELIDAKSRVRLS